MNGFSEIESDQDKPLMMVCDRDCLRVIETFFSHDTSLLSDWLSGKTEADVVICKACESNEWIRSTRTRDATIYVVAIVESLQSELVAAVFQAGADEAITIAEIASGRLELLLSQHFQHGRSPASEHHDSRSVLKHAIAPQPDAVADVECSELEVRNNFMSALSDVSMRLLERKSADELMDHIALQASSLASVDSAFVSVLDDSGQHMEIVGATGRFADFKGFKHQRAEDVAGLAWDLDELVLVESQASEQKHMALWGDYTKRCAVPFFAHEQFSGVVCMPLDSLDNSLENYLDILKLFTRTVSIAIENSNLITEQKAELARHSAIGEITQSFYAATNLHELIDGVCKSLLSVFNSRHVSVCRVEADDKFSLLAEWQKTGEKIERANYVNVRLMPNSISQWSVENKQKALVRRGVQDQRAHPAAEKIKKLLGIGCTICIPMMQDEVVWGVLILGKCIDQRDFTDVELSLLDLLMAQLSSSVMRQNLLDKIHFQAFHDSLTKLPNRLKFENALNELVANENQSEEQFALLFLDLDGFKAVNDNQGHSVGDELLKQVAKRLAGCLQDKDLLARMGGDEFAVLLRGVKSRESALAISHRLSSAIAQKFLVNNYNLKIGVSTGLSFYPENGETVDDLLRNADFAMYEAKAAGNSCVKSFNLTMAKQYRTRIALENDLLSAIENEQFELYYQPKVDLVQGDVSGVEALLRWKHPTHGFVSPGEFVPLAEEAGYITEIGKWVLNESIRQMAEWNVKGMDNLSIAVNISAPQFVLEDFSSGVIQILKNHKLDPTCLELEVTESVVMNNLSKVVDTLQKLRDQGITIAIDDFGTGYSSLAYLENLPLDCMKIDKVFVDKIGSGSEQYSLVNTILTMARALGLSTVAEGVEKEEQLNQLMALGCECVQGFYFSRPVPADDIVQTIAGIQEQFHEHRKAG